MAAFALPPRWAAAISPAREVTASLPPLPASIMWTRRGLSESRTAHLRSFRDGSAMTSEAEEFPRVTEDTPSSLEDPAEAPGAPDDGPPPDDPSPVAVLNFPAFPHMYASRSKITQGSACPSHASIGDVKEI